MVNGGEALGIKIPQRAPAVAIKTSASALIDECSPYAVINNRAVMRAFKASDSINTLRVYCAICGHVNKKTGLANPSQIRIAQLLGVARETVNRAVSRLIKLGLLELDHKRPAPGGKGSLLFLRVVFVQGMSAADAQSIASSGVIHSSLMGQSGVTQANAPPYETPSVTDKRVSDTPTRINGVPYVTPTVGSHLRHLVSHELPEHKNTHGQALKTEGEVIERWQAHAWTHAKENPVANEDDLATAHALVAKGITDHQLELAVICDPESPRLRPVVKGIL